MTPGLKTYMIMTLFLTSTCHAQSVQFLPEIDAHLKLEPSVRVYLQAKDYQDAGAPQQLEIGPSIELYIKSLPLRTREQYWQKSKSTTELHWPCALSLNYNGEEMKTDCIDRGHQDLCDRQEKGKS